MLSKSDVKYIQSLAHKKHRFEEGAFVLEGIKMVDELLTSFPERIIKIYATQNWAHNHSNVSKNRANLVLVEQFELEKISFLSTPNEVLALVSLVIKDQEINLNKGITLVLDHLQDPGNLGTIIRTCDWFGIENIVCSSGTVDAFSPKVVQASMGSIMRLNIFYKDLLSFLESSTNIPIYSAELQGESINEVKFSKPSILIIGNESKGVSKEISHFASKKIMIPRYGYAESLNAAVASSIILSTMMK